MMMCDVLNDIWQIMIGGGLGDDGDMQLNAKLIPFTMVMNNDE
jgi:hypothetical protein